MITSRSIRNDLQPKNGVNRDSKRFFSPRRAWLQPVKRSQCTQLWTEGSQSHAMLKWQYLK